MSNDNRSEVRVWDPLVRLFHWSLVAGFITAWATQEESYELHVQAGYLVLGLVCFRIVWGLIGPRHARFRDFLFGPTTTLAYMKDALTGHARRYLGHNPAGGMMVLALLLTLLGLTLSGIALDGAENRAGPLAGTRVFLYGDLIKEIHEQLTHLMLLLIPLHLLGVFFSSRAHDENLVRAMITGNKRNNDQDEA